jgi:hypothetical protein
MTSTAERGTREAGARGKATKLARRAVFAIVLFLVAAASFNGFYSKMAFREGDSARGFAAIIDGSAARPYIYRQLVPATANLAGRIAPDSLRQKLTCLRSDDGRSFYASLFSSPIAQNPTYSFRYLIFYLVTFVGSLTAAFSYYLVCRTEGYLPEVSLVSASLLILLIPYVQIRGGGYYNDFPEAAFVALAVLLARNAHWIWLVPVAFLGTLNKETFVLVLLALWPILKHRSGTLLALLQVIALEFIAVGVYLWTRLRFSGNPGGTVEFHLRDQIAYLAHPGLWLFKFGRVYGVLVPELATLVPALILAWMIRYAWKELSPPMRQYAWMMAWMNLPLFFLFCMPGEVRDLSLLYIVVLLSIAATLSPSRRLPMSDSAPLTQNADLSQSVNWEPVRSQS